MEINNEFKKDAKEAVKRGVLFAFCPTHLEIEGRKELWVFPFNILFAKYRNESDGSLTMGSALMNDAVYKFKRYEDSSLVYTGINKHEGEKIGGWDTVISQDEFRDKSKEIFVNNPSKSF